MRIRDDREEAQEVKFPRFSRFPGGPLVENIRPGSGPKPGRSEPGVVIAPVTQRTKWVLGVVLIVFALSVALVVGTYYGTIQLTYWGWGAVAGIVAACTLAMYPVALQGGPDRLATDSSGVTFQTFGKSTHISWDRFDPKLTQAPNGLLRFTYRTSDKPAGRLFGYAAADLGVPMARAMLTCPSAPRWEPSPKLSEKWQKEVRGSSSA
jgi:hypothetical protein